MPYKQVSLSIGATLGNLAEIRLLVLFEWKGRYIWVLFLDPEDIKILNLGAIWNFGKGTGLSWADIRLWDTQSAIRPRWIGTVSAWMQWKSIYLSWDNLLSASSWLADCTDHFVITTHTYFYKHVKDNSLHIYYSKTYFDAKLLKRI